MRASGVWNQYDSDRRKGSFVLVIQRCSGPTWEAGAWGEREDKLAVCHTAVVSWQLECGQAVITDRLNSNEEKCRQTFAQHLFSLPLLWVNATFFFFVLLFVLLQLKVVLHKIMIMPALCRGRLALCQYIWHFEESGFEV